MGKKLDVITDKCKCTVRAYILEKKEYAKPITIDIANNPKQKGWMGKRVGDTYKIPNAGITYRIDAIEEFSEINSILKEVNSQKQRSMQRKTVNQNISFTPVVNNTNMSHNTVIRNRVFWVFQNKTFEKESRDEYLFAGFNGPHHWGRLREVRKDHIIIHGYHQEVVAVSVAKDSAYPWTRLSDEDKKYGRRIDCEYYFLRRPIRTSARKEKNIEFCRGANYQPFDCNGDGNQGYLFDMTSKLRDYYISEIIKYNPDILNKIPELRKYTVL